MSILQHDLPGAAVADLFAGSGALGLEALSRGATHATFVEQDTANLVALRRNIDALGATAECDVVRDDVIRYLDRHPEAEFDVAFADPPYRTGLAAATAAHWIAAPFAGVLAVEHATDEPVPDGGDRRRYGSTAITFYRR